MKKLLFTVSALLLAGNSFSQTIMSENFDAATTLPTGWTQLNIDGLTPASGVSFMGTNAWLVRPKATGSSDNQVVSTSWYGPPAGISNDWLVSPSIAVPATGTNVVQFDAMAPDANYSDGFKVYISTSPITAASLPTTAVLTVPEAANAYTTYSVPLTSFAGQNVYVAIQNYSNDMYLLFVDNFKVRTLVNNDAILTSASLNRYSAVSTNNNLVLDVKNDGANAITALTVNWNDGTDHIQTITGLNIASGASASVTHPTAVSYATVVEKNINITITAVNGAVDATNVTAAKKINTVSQIVEKSVVIEEGTGTWCVWCPRGAVAMEYMYDTYPTRFIGVAVHNGDPMTVTEYDDGANLSGFPGCNVDRALKDESVSKTLFEGYYNARKDITVPAAISATATWNGANVSVAVTSTFKTVFANANYRLGVIMIEDKVTGTGAAYNQANAYAGGTNGVMGGYESLPNPVPAAQMVYDHVGRALLGGYDGQASSVPASITNNQAVNYTFNYTVPATSKRYLMSAIAVLIDNTTGEIINASKVALTAAGVEEVASIGMEVYPNPASGSVTIKFDATSADYAVAITDLSGRQVASKVIANANGSQTVDMPIEGLATGNYLVTVSSNGASFTQNLMVK
jgi:hypothetical protein